MKKFFTILAIAAMALCNFTLTSCESEEDEKQIEEVKTDYGTATITESSDELVMSMDIMGLYQVEVVAKFKKDKCNSMVEKITFASEALAKMVYAELEEEAKEEGYKVSIKGATITVDVTKEAEGLSKQEVKAMMMEIIKEFEAGEGGLF